MSSFTNSLPAHGSLANSGSGGIHWPDFAPPTLSSNDLEFLAEAGFRSPPPDNPSAHHPYPLSDASPGAARHSQMYHRRTSQLAYEGAVALSVPAMPMSHTGLHGTHGQNPIVPAQSSPMGSPLVALLPSHSADTNGSRYPGYGSPHHAQEWTPTSSLSTPSLLSSPHSAYDSSPTSTRYSVSPSRSPPRNAPGGSPVVVLPPGDDRIFSRPVASSRDATSTHVSPSEDVYDAGLPMPRLNIKHTRRRNVQRPDLLIPPATTLAAPPHDSDPLAEAGETMGQETAYYRAHSSDPSTPSHFSSPYSTFVSHEPRSTHHTPLSQHTSPYSTPSSARATPPATSPCANGVLHLSLSAANGIMKKTRSRNIQVAAAAIDIPEGSLACPVPGCFYVQSNGRRPDLRAHVETHTREYRDALNGPDWLCCGVPLEEAESYGVKDIDAVRLWGGRMMVGGCWSVFRTKWNYQRHLGKKLDECYGSQDGPWVPGNIRERMSA